MSQLRIAVIELTGAVCLVGAAIADNAVVIICFVAMAVLKFATAIWETWRL